jgi:hypothetical protein
MCMNSAELRAEGGRREEDRGGFEQETDRVGEREQEFSATLTHSLGQKCGNPDRITGLLG